MIVKIQILTDDGGTVLAEQFGPALFAFGQAFPPGGPLARGGETLRGYCYLPVPPPFDPGDEAGRRRLAAQFFGG